jgi:esterase/lipase
MNESDFSKDIEIDNNSDVCVFMFHGLSATPFELTDWAGSIAELGVDVKAPLLPLHGVNSELLCSVKSVDVFYEFGKKFIEDLKKKYKVVIGFGISLGGGIIFDYLVNKGGNMDAAVMLGTGGFAAKEMGLLVWLVRIFNLEAMRNPFINEYDRSLFPKEYFEWKSENIPKVPVKMLMKALYKQKREGIVQKLSRITCPTMLINGTKGLLTNRKSIEKYFKVIPAKRKYGLIVEGATHTVHKSQFNEQILDHLIKFISELIKSKEDKKEIEGEDIIILNDSSTE